jgi:hypothetical protein
MYDIFFISYKELNAEENFLRLKNRFPFVRKIIDVKGIHQAHYQAASKSLTKMFWVVDGDAQVLDSFNFDYFVPEYDLDVVHTWNSENPVNGLVYGYGGVKLLPKFLTLKMDLTSTDMTTSISPKFKLIDQVSNITAFNTDPFSAWRSAFRECAKLSSKIIKNQIDDETEYRLKVWTTVVLPSKYNEYVLLGANSGKLFAESQPDQLFLINDFEWLENKFKEEYRK